MKNQLVFKLDLGLVKLRDISKVLNEQGYSSSLVTDDKEDVRESSK